jgi:hypothetical protein
LSLIISGKVMRCQKFSWQLMLYRFTTKDNLTFWGIGNDMAFSFYNANAEKTVHLFLHCGTWCCHRAWVTPSLCWSGVGLKIKVRRGWC